MLGCKTIETTLADHQTVNIVISIPTDARLPYNILHAAQ